MRSFYYPNFPHLCSHCFWCFKKTPLIRLSHREVFHGSTLLNSYIYKMQNMTFGSDGGLTKACEAEFPTEPGQ